MYLTGLVSNLLNPKIGVFFIAFLPGFIPSRSPAPAVTFGLGLWFVTDDVSAGTKRRADAPGGAYRSRLRGQLHRRACTHVDRA
jgi:threonine/homoserine/homoserine lactone efflux protein